MKLRSKIIVYLFVPVLLIGIFVGINNVNQDRHRLITRDINLIEEKLKEASLKINASNMEAVTVARTIAASQESGLFGQREDSVVFLRKVLENNPQFIGVSIGYEPNADGKDAETIAEYKQLPLWSGTKGRYLPYWYRDLQNDGRITLERLVDMDSSLYYQGVREAYTTNPELTFLITEPYIYNNNNLIIEQMAPIIINGAFRGVCGVDRSLDYLQTYLHEIKAGTYETAQFMLVSGRGRIIATTYSKKGDGEKSTSTGGGTDLRTIKTNELYVEPSGDGGQFVSDIFLSDGYVLNADKDKLATLPDRSVDSSYKNWFEDVVGKDTAPIEFHDPISGDKAYLTSAYIPTGGWRLVMTVSKDEITGPIIRSILYTGVTALMGMFIILIIIVLFANGFSSRIIQAADLAKRVAKGDLTASVTTDTKDETGELLRSIQTMVDSLNSLLLQVKQSTIQLVSTATRITGTAKQQESTIQDFGASTAQIASAVNEITATSRELYNTMGGVSDNSCETASLAETGRRQLMEMGQTMENLSDATQSISGKLAVISEKAQNINKVVNAISKVSEQTNLLSLNAAIEAEKAGEYGLGFAVVAREIRRLANQTAQASVDIKSIVGEMQGAVSSGVMEMDKFSDGVRGGVGEVGELTEQLGTIISRVQDLTPRFDTVKEGMLSQTQGAQQISEAMSQLRDGAQRTSESLKEFDKATMALHQAVTNLRGEVSRFKVSERNATGVTRMPFPMGVKKKDKKS